ncbi:hypothetical protein BURPS305_2207 [Burkholderia pseudomallei 305]|nr:hypothetical protein BURPS305_2207 [Burkholderia pseudomallei 305]
MVRASAQMADLLLPTIAEPACGRQRQRAPGGEHSLESGRQHASAEHGNTRCFEQGGNHAPESYETNAARYLGDGSEATMRSTDICIECPRAVFCKLR